MLASRYSRIEIKRRKVAFLQLIISFTVGFIIFSNIFHVLNYLPYYILIIVILAIMYLLTSNFLNLLARQKIIINEKEIQQDSGKKIGEYLFSEINSITIKRRNNRVIREIYIYFSNHKNLFISAFENDFETIKDTVLKRINKNVRISEVFEPIDYDHFLFYPVLGMTISFFSIFLFNKLIFASFSSLRVFIIVASIYVFSIGIFFIFKTPIANQLGRKQLFSDYIFGAGMILACMVMLLIFQFTVGF